MNARAFAGLFLVVRWSIGLPAIHAQGVTPVEIVRLAEQSVYPDAFLMQANLQTLESQRVVSSIEMSVSYKRGVGSRIELLEPPRSRGIRFLQKEDALWLFNPQAGTSQAIRLSPRAAFQGSVFSNRDVGDPQFSLQYDIRVTPTVTLDHPQLGHVSAMVLEGTAKSEAAAYSRVKLWVRSSDYLLLQAEYYAKSGFLFKRAIFSGIRELAGRERPTSISMISFDQPDKESIMTIRTLSEKPDLPDSQFTLAALTR
ncbi:MAG TPA: outer membrane lipoprotein-sorting protein [Spirochaetia bacterium]|nr:outer membrane lipoprotein-sorting protein [Spirochaetia bacterium]